MNLLFFITSLLVNQKVVSYLAITYHISNKRSSLSIQITWEDMLGSNRNNYDIFYYVYK